MQKPIEAATHRVLAARASMPWISQSAAEAETQDPGSYGHIPEQVPPPEELAALVKAALAAKLEHAADAVFAHCTHTTEKSTHSEKQCGGPLKNAELHVHLHEPLRQDPSRGLGNSISIASTVAPSVSVQSDSYQLVGSLLLVLDANPVRSGLLSLMSLWKAKNSSHLGAPRMTVKSVLTNSKRGQYTGQD